MTYTKDQMEALSPYEEHFITAVRARWCRYPGQDALRRIHQIFTSATGDRRRLNSSCGVCILHLMRDAGTAYLKDKEELARAEEPKPAPKPKPKKKTTKKKSGD